MITFQVAQLMREHCLQLCWCEKFEQCSVHNDKWLAAADGERVGVGDWVLADVQVWGLHLQHVRGIHHKRVDMWQLVWTHQH